MPSQRITVVVSQGQSHNPAKRKLEEDIVGGLLGLRGIEVTIVPHLYDLAPDGTGMLCLSGISGDMVICSWLFPRAARWILSRNGIRGREGETLLIDETDEDEAEVQDAVEAEAEEKQRVADAIEVPTRSIYCLDLRSRDDPKEFIREIQRIASEATTETVELSGWLGGSPAPEQTERFLNPAAGNVDAKQASSNGNGAPASDTAATDATPMVIEETADRRWYPVIDFSRCTNCLECIDFCLFGVYGVDTVDTILVEQPDNCRKGCPACSRVCPENAIIFPQHKSPAIAGSPEVLAGGLKIDLSKLFGAPDIDATEMAVRERDEQLLQVGRDAVGHEVGLPKRQPTETTEAKDELDTLMDQLDELDL